MFAARESVFIHTDRHPDGSNSQPTLRNETRTRKSATRSCTRSLMPWLGPSTVTMRFGKRCVSRLGRGRSAVTVKTWRCQKDPGGPSAQAARWNTTDTANHPGKWGGTAAPAGSAKGDWFGARLGEAQIFSTPVLSPNLAVGTPIRSNKAKYRFIKGISLFFG